MSVDHEAIVETMNEYLDEMDLVADGYRTSGAGTWIERDSESVLGSGVADRVLEEHNAVLVKSLYFPNRGVTRMWFREIEIEEVTKQNVTFK